MELLNRARRALLELIYPRRAVCMGCGSAAGFERDWLCEDCRQALAKRWVGAAPAPRRCDVDAAAFAYDYGGPAGGLVRNLKYGGVRRLAGPMSRAMADAFEGLQPAAMDLVVPVPMHPRRLRRRGIDHAGELAERTAERLALPCVHALARIRDTVQQARLSDEERMYNLDDAFALVAPVAGKRVLLIDDVCTTGSTAGACARTLRKGGAAAVYLLCYAVAGGR